MKKVVSRNWIFWNHRQRIMIKHTFWIWRLILWILVLQTMIKKSAFGIFFISCKIPPTKCKLLFAIYIANPKKKNFPYSCFFNFFPQKVVAFGERIPKRYNTWVLTSYFADLEHINYCMQKMCKKMAQICIHDPNTQVSYLFGILSPNATTF